MAPDDTPGAASGASGRSSRLPPQGEDARAQRRGAKKFSSDKSEDPPELSAGSSESEDLPDPTRASYRPVPAGVNGPSGDKAARSGFFAGRVDDEEWGSRDPP
jgi:hypothetical protein